MDPETKQSDRKKRSSGFRASFDRFIEALFSYLDTVLLYLQRYAEVFLNKLFAKTIGFFLILFAFCIGFVYLSLTVYYFFHIYLGLDTVLSNLAVSLIFLIISFLLLHILIRRR